MELMKVSQLLIIQGQVNESTHQAVRTAPFCLRRAKKDNAAEAVMPNDHRLPLSLTLLFWSTIFQQTICTSKTSHVTNKDGTNSRAISLDQRPGWEQYPIAVISPIEDRKWYLIYPNLPNVPNS